MLRISVAATFLGSLAGAGLVAADSRTPLRVAGAGGGASMDAGSTAGENRTAVASAQPTADIEWLPARGRECQRRGRYSGHCQGPRRVPRPHGEAAVLAERLGLGTYQVGQRLLVTPPHAEWVNAVGSAPAADLLWPVEGGTFGRGFGHTRKRRRWILHKGVDIGAPIGAPIRAVNDGIVAYSDNGIRGYGNMLMLVHADGSVSSYAHCRSTFVFPGQRVTRGQVVAEVGVTGITHGPHLHFEWRQRGRPRNPMRFMVGREGRRGNI